MKMFDLMEKYPEHNQECFCRLKSGLYRVYWYDSSMRAFMSNGVLVYNITHWVPVHELIKKIFDIKEGDN